ncbi:MAG: nuclear transport factor 2 family protein [Acidobacteriia bacterium]|nr:nuclear transport factor 2 family protein [Terriglobia bacterium]
MRKLATLLAILTIAAAQSLAQSKTSNDTAEFKALIQHYWEGWSTLNTDNVASLYSQDPDAVFFDVAPLKYNGWAEYKEGFKKAFATAASASIAANDDLKVTRRGKIAWTSNTFHGTVNQKEGPPMQLTGRQTDIWEKRGGHWIIVHEHISAPLQ